MAWVESRTESLLLVTSGYMCESILAASVYVKARSQTTCWPQSLLGAAGDAMRNHPAPGKAEDSRHTLLLPEEHYCHAGLRPRA